MLHRVADLGTELDTSDLIDESGDNPQLASSLRIAMTRLSRRLRSERSDESLGLSQLSALNTLERYGRLSPTAMAEIEWIQPPSMTRVIAALEARGLACREPHPTDRRQAVIAITDEGRAIVEEDRRRREAWLARVLRSLSPGELDALRTALPVLERLGDS